MDEAKFIQKLRTLLQKDIRTAVQEETRKIVQEETRKIVQEETLKVVQSETRKIVQEEMEPLKKEVKKQGKLLRLVKDDQDFIIKEFDSRLANHDKQLFVINHHLGLPTSG